MRAILTFAGQSILYAAFMVSVLLGVSIFACVINVS